MIDALRAKNYSALRELLYRRLAGVHAADSSDNWALCDAFELVMDKQSFVPDAFMQRAVKNVMRIQALEKQVKGSGKGGHKTRNAAAASQSESNKKKAAPGNNNGSSGSGTKNPPPAAGHNAKGSGHHA